MKKILLTAMMLAMMVCGTAFAGQTGNAFSAEEDIALSVVSNMIKGQRNAVVAHFVPDMAQKYTEEAHKASMSNIAKEFGAISNIRMVQATRNYDEAGRYQSDAMLLLMNAKDGKIVAANVLFIPDGKQIKIAAVAIRPVEVQRR